MAAGDRLWTLHELLWVVAAERDEAAQYLAMEGLELGEGTWGKYDVLEDWLMLVAPESDVAFEDPADGEVYAQTAREFAESVPTGHVVDER